MRSSCFVCRGAFLFPERLLNSPHVQSSRRECITGRLSRGRTARKFQKASFRPGNASPSKRKLQAHRRSGPWASQKRRDESELSRESPARPQHAADRIEKRHCLNARPPFDVGNLGRERHRPHHRRTASPPAERLDDSSAAFAFAEPRSTLSGTRIRIANTKKRPVEQMAR